MGADSHALARQKALQHFVPATAPRAEGLIVVLPSPDKLLRTPSMAEGKG